MKISGKLVVSLEREREREKELLANARMLVAVIPNYPEIVTKKFQTDTSLSRSGF